MTHRLVIIRHAKTEKTHPDGDHERELIQRGIDDARELGRWLADERLLPDLVLVSTSARTRQTAKYLLQGASFDAQVWGSRRIYDGPAERVLSAIHETPESATTLWVVGHQPVLGHLVMDLVDEETSDPAAVAGVAEGLRVTSASVLRTPDPWEALGAGDARLVAYHVARA